MTGRGRILDIQHFSLNDGPGTRTTVFFQGCNLRCAWCHNPESQPPRGALLHHPARCIACGACVAACPNATAGKTARHTEACALCGACAEACYAEALRAAGKEIFADELFARLIADREVYERSGGGVTLSGGEPLLQPEFARELLGRLRAEGIHTAIETALNVPRAVAQSVAARADLIFADVKCVTEETHRAFAGAGNARILDNIGALSAMGANLVLRVPVVPGFNADEAEMGKIAEFAHSLPNRHPVELMAYHGMCSPKYHALGRAFPMDGTPEPAPETMERFAGILRDRGIAVKISM